jgi:CYTH domain-containing protein
LLRLEIEFESVEELNNFKIPPWAGREITETELGNDSKLILLDKNKFLEILRRYI